MYDATLGIFVYIKRRSALLELMNSSHNILAPTPKFNRLWARCRYKICGHLATSPLTYLRTFRPLPCTTNPACISLKIPMVSRPISPLGNAPDSLSLTPCGHATAFRSLSGNHISSQSQSSFLASTSKSPPPIASLPLPSCYYTWGHSFAPLTANTSAPPVLQQSSILWVLSAMRYCHPQQPHIIGVQLRSEKGGVTLSGLKWLECIERIALSWVGWADWIN